MAEFQNKHFAEKYVLFLQCAENDEIIKGDETTKIFSLE